jgi:hypothetical protein
MIKRRPVLIEVKAEPRLDKNLRNEKEGTSGNEETFPGRREIFVDEVRGRKE